jgi:hypothetical protein
MDGNDALFDALRQHVIKELPSYDHHSLAVTAYAFANAGQNEHILFSKLQQACLARLQGGFSPEDLTLVAGAFVMIPPGTISDEEHRALFRGIGERCCSSGGLQGFSKGELRRLGVALQRAEVEGLEGALECVRVAELKAKEDRPN